MAPRFALFIVASAAWISATPLENSLRQIHIYFRHGQRTPADTYPLDPYINEKFSPYGWGQLTNEGKREQYSQGQFLRERYDSFLGDTFSTKHVEAITTGVDRTKMSMGLMMAGLWPPKNNQIWNNELLWQPVPYSSQELNKDTLLLVRSCPRYAEVMNGLLQSDEIKIKLEPQKELYQFLSENTGKNISNPDDVQDIYSTLKAEEDFGLRLPEWTSKVYPDKMRQVAAFSFVLNAFNPELQKIKSGPMIKKLLNDVENLKEGKSEKKFIANAGHDSTISNLMIGLKIWDEQIPVYNIMAIVEIHEIDNIYGMKFYLRNSSNHEPYELTVPGCGFFCPIEDFKKTVESILPEEHSIMCKVKDATFNPGEEGGP